MVLWVFGYGSLIWKPSFSYEERVVGYVKNYRRAFHQACIDFRGTQEKPGRTLTLEEQAGAETWGVAYRVSASVEAQLVEAYLNQRERTYDVRTYVDVYTADCPHTPAVYDSLMYIATRSSSNLWYLGPASLQEMANQIARSRGPAGANHEYLFQLEKSLTQFGAACVDKEVVELANEVRRILYVDENLFRRGESLIGAACVDHKIFHSDNIIRQPLQNRHRGDLDGIAGSGMAWRPHYGGARQLIAS